MTERKQITNWIWSNSVDENGDAIKPKKIPRDDLAEIVKEAREALGEFPAALSGVGAFAPAKDGGRAEYLPTARDVEGWVLMNHPGLMNWEANKRFISKEIFFNELIKHGPEYSAARSWPHLPDRVAGVYYSAKTIEPTPPNEEGKALNGFLDFMSFKGLDRDLYTLFLMTAIWGGPPGQRPGFMFSGGGRGSGKTTAVALAAELFDEQVMYLSVEDNKNAVCSRLFSDGGRAAQFLLWDNVKSQNWSNAGLEQLMTSETISGKALYRGEGSAVNLFIFAFTMNGVHVSADLAQRMVSIFTTNLQESFKGDWLVNVKTYINAHRADILADLAAMFSREPTEIKNRIRWASWETEVLARLTNNKTRLTELQQLVLERQNDTNADSAEGDDLENAVAYWIESELGVEDGRDVSVWVPNIVISHFLKEQQPRLCKGGPGVPMRAFAGYLTDQALLNFVKTGAKGKGRRFKQNGFAQLWLSNDDRKSPPDESYDYASTDLVDRQPPLPPPPNYRNRNR